MYGHLYFLKSPSKLLTTTNLCSRLLSLSARGSSSFLLLLSRPITLILSKILKLLTISLRLSSIWTDWSSLLFGIYLAWWSLSCHTSTRIALTLADISKIWVVLSVLLLESSRISALCTWRPTYTRSLAIDLLLLHLLLLIKLLLKLVGSPLILENPLIKILSSIGWIALCVLIVIHYQVILLVLLVWHYHSWGHLSTILEVLPAHRELLALAANTTGPALSQARLRIHLVHVSLRFVGLLVLSIGQLLLTLDCGPINAITYGFTTSTENWECPKPWVCSKNLFPIFFRSHIIRAVKWPSQFV